MIKTNTGYVDVSNLIIEPISNVEVGSGVVVKNGNGCWYMGVIKTNEQWHNAMVSKKRIKGVLVDFPSISLILQKENLFKII